MLILNSSGILLLSYIITFLKTVRTILGHTVMNILFTKCGPKIFPFLFKYSNQDLNRSATSFVWFYIQILDRTKPNVKIHTIKLFTKITSFLSEDSYSY